MGGKMKTETEFLEGIIRYCNTMRAQCGKTILDDFNYLIKSRIAELTERGGRKDGK